MPQPDLSALWDEHTKHEFATRDTEATLDHSTSSGVGVGFSFTHSQEMPWMLPGVAPTNARVEVALVAIVRFREGKLAHEHIYWDQASVLKQIGVLTDPSLPVCGVEAARKIAGDRS